MKKQTIPISQLGDLTTEKLTEMKLPAIITSHKAKLAIIIDYPRPDDDADLANIMLEVRELVRGKKSGG